VVDEASAVAQSEESAQAMDVVPQAPKSLQERAEGMVRDFQSDEPMEAPTLESILEKQAEEDKAGIIDLVDQGLRAAARKNGLSDRELLGVLNEIHNQSESNEGDPQQDFLDNPLLIDKTKARILTEAPSFASLISSEEEAAPRILSANECISNTPDQRIFEANVQITANLAQNIEGITWMDDSQRKNAQFALVYKSDDGAFKTLFLSDQDAQEIGKSMADLNVKDRWMFNAAGIPTSANPLATIESDVLNAGRKAATDLAILYGNFHHLNSTDSTRQALQEHVRSPEARESFLKRVQILRPREHDDAVEFLNAA
jgi:hypothetical protein